MITDSNVTDELFVSPFPYLPQPKALLSTRFRDNQSEIALFASSSGNLKIICGDAKILLNCNPKNFNSYETEFS